MPLSCGCYIHYWVYQKKAKLVGGFTLAACSPLLRAVSLFIGVGLVEVVPEGQVHLVTLRGWPSLRVGARGARVCMMVCMRVTCDASWRAFGRESTARRENRVGADRPGPQPVEVLGRLLVTNETPRDGLLPGPHLQASLGGIRQPERPYNARGELFGEWCGGLSSGGVSDWRWEGGRGSGIASTTFPCGRELRAALTKGT